MNNQLPVANGKQALETLRILNNKKIPRGKAGKSIKKGKNNNIYLCEELIPLVRHKSKGADKSKDIQNPRKIKLENSEYGKFQAKLSQNTLEKLNSHGYVIIDDFLPKSLHNDLLKELDQTPAKINFQIRPHHYSHVFKSSIPNLPNENESYIAKFKMLEDRESLKSLRKAFEEYIAPILKAATNNKAQYALYPGAVRLGSGDVYRTHQDSYAGIIGYSLFVNHGWKWDYGGILTYVRDEQTVEPIFPVSNRLLLRNESFKHFHFLNTIEQYSTCEQYIILGWADQTQGEASPTRGKYTRF